MPHESKPAAYVRKQGRNVQKATGKRSPVPVARADRRLAPPSPDPQFDNVTGRYETDDDLFTLQVNQAGRHLEAWLVEYSTKKLSRLQGDLLGSDQFQLSVVTGQGQSGRLVVDPLGQHIFEFDGRKNLLKRVGRAPVLSDSVLFTLPADYAAFTERSEHFPLLRADVARIRNALRTSVMEVMINDFFAASSGSDVAAKMERATKAEVIDAHVRKLFATVHPQDFPLADDLAQRILGDQLMIVDGETRSQLDLLQSMTSTVEQEKTGTFGEMEQLKQHLKLRDNSGGPHEYAFDLVVVGASGDFGIGAGGFFGELTITKTKGPESGLIGTFAILIGSVSGGASLGGSFGFKTSGSAKTVNHWRARNFPGVITVTEASARAAPIPQLTRSATGFYFMGNGEFPHLVADFSGSFQDFGIGLGVEINGQAGYLFRLGAKITKPKPGTHRVDNDYTVERNFETQVHFALGSALLTDEGRQLLRIFCANELRGLASKSSRLTISSHADRVDGEDRNVELSTLRAQNTLQALRDILGTSFGIPNERISLLGLGEQGAIAAGDKDNTKNPARRKSELVMDARLLVSLHGKP